MKYLFLIVGSVLVLASCSSAKVRIMPMENGVNKVISSDREKEDAEEAAIKEANKYCEKGGQRMVIVKEQKTAYNGQMNENTRKTVRNASKTAMMMGQAGGVLSQAGMSGYSMTNDRDYEAQFMFTCK